MALGEGGAGTVPRLGLETVIVLEAHLDALAEGAEEGVLVLRVPAEAGALAVGGGVVAARAGVAGGLAGLGGVVLVLRHAVGDGGRGPKAGTGAAPARGDGPRTRGDNGGAAIAVSDLLGAGAGAADESLVVSRTVVVTAGDGVKPACGGGRSWRRGAGGGGGSGGVRTRVDGDPGAWLGLV